MNEQQEGRAAEAAPQTPVVEQPSTSGSAEPKAPLLVKGQGTAIVTGAISIIFGVAYLLLVTAMDMRGGQLLPPPPEAFIP